MKPERLESFLQEMIDDAEGSVLHEPGCRRFDVIQDEDDPTKIGLCEVYNDQAAIDDHLTRPHFTHWRETTADWVVGPAAVSQCRVIFPAGDGNWDSLRSAAVKSPAFSRGLYVVYAPLLVQDDRVQDFLDALCLDAIASVNEEPGCLRFDIFQNKENPAELYLYEVYVNELAFDYHVATPHFEQWFETTKGWYAPGFSVDESEDVVNGSNVWPPDNWQWGSGMPLR